MSNTAGVCAIKQEYVVPRPNSSEVNDGKRKIDNNEENYTEDKKAKCDQKEQWKPKNKQRGQNKARPRTFHDDKRTKPCPTIANIKSEEERKDCTFKNCMYIHSALEYIKSKPEDLGETCHVFNIRGLCPRGIECRFASKHITDEGYNVMDDEKFKLWKDDIKNTLQFSLQTLLHKKNYDLSLSERLVKAIDPRNKPQVNKDESAETKKTSGCITDEDLIKLLPREKKTIDWKDKLFLSPLTTVGNLPFRRICKEYGADITCGEMALCEQLLKGFKQEWALIKRHESEDIFGAQICGNNPFIITKAAQLLQENTELDFIDLNMGCPIDLIYKNGGGSGMMHRLNNLETTVRSASNLLSIPFTVKMRTGVHEGKKLAHTIVPKMAEWGASLITLHGRSKEGRYTKSADWEYIETCAKLAAPCPLVGNGDILSYEDFLHRKEIAPTTVGVMIGRGALIKPWIFTEMKEQRQWDISSKERFEILKKYTNYGLEHWGSDTLGVENTRRFLLEWLSFLYRYVPVGLLESPPQKINERPPAYMGRDDLETLMASGDCADWIKISEMLLGPVPLGFHFVPKHKSNSYQG